MIEGSSGPRPDPAGTADDGETDVSERVTGSDPVSHPGTEPEPSPDPASNDAARPGRTRIGPGGTYEPL